MSDNAVTTFQEIEKADGHRPLSVESQLLNDPQVFQQRPRAGHKVLEDDLLYRPKKQQMYKPVVKF